MMCVRAVVVSNTKNAMGARNNALQADSEDAPRLLAAVSCSMRDPATPRLLTEG